MVYSTWRYIEGQQGTRFRLALLPCIASWGNELGKPPMVKIALHDGIRLSDADIVDALLDMASSEGAPNPTIDRFENPVELVDQASSPSSEPYDLFILPYDLPGIKGIHAVEEVRSIHSNLKSIIFAPSGDFAAEAAASLIDGFLVDPASLGGFSRTLKRILHGILAIHAKSTLVNGREGIRRVAFDQVIYCMTSGHDQVMHLLDGTTISTRCSSQAMFDLLSEDSRFFKLGSSFIINLYEVTEVQSSKGIVILSNSRELNVPARLRKSLESTLLGFGT